MLEILQTNIEGLELFRRGKVRDVYSLDDYLLIISTDRISAFDVIMNEPIPEKGKILNQISAFWFNKTISIVPNHLIATDVDEFIFICSPKYADILKKNHDLLQGRSMLVKKTKPLPVECIVRGYVAGSGWKEYKGNQQICGIPLPSGLLEYSKLPSPIFTPSTKAETGHDENIGFTEMTKIIGVELSEKIRDISIQLYEFAASHLEKNNLILADTKFEFGLSDTNQIIFIDEALTPDSSRFWLMEDYAPGKEQVNFDKQILRNYLESITWNKQPPPPKLPPEIIQKTADKYQEAFRRIVI